jgi:hypothetical protein
MAGPGRVRRRMRAALAALGRCLSTFGAMHIALADPTDRADRADRAGVQHTGPAGYAGRGGHGGGGVGAGPPAAHPERLVPHTPLTEQEMRLARQLWPASYPQRRDRGR